MPARKDLDPLKMLSLVEGEVLGDRLPDVPVADDEARGKLLALIRSNPVERERYMHLKLGVTALCEMPRLDAPTVVWEHLDARFEEALAESATGRAATPALGRVGGIRRGLVALRRFRRIAIAAACLLVLVGGLWMADGLPWSESPSSSSNVIFVQGKPKSSPATAQAVIGEFFFKVPKRIQGVSSEAVMRFLDTPPTED
jgi:hypothetical protein